MSAIYPEGFRRHQRVRPKVIDQAHIAWLATATDRPSLTAPARHRQAHGGRRHGDEELSCARLHARGLIASLRPPRRMMVRAGPSTDAVGKARPHGRGHHHSTHCSCSANVRREKWAADAACTSWAQASPAGACGVLHHAATRTLGLMPIMTHVPGHRHLTACLLHVHQRERCRPLRGAPTAGTPDAGHRRGLHPPARGRRRDTGRDRRHFAAWNGRLNSIMESPSGPCAGWTPRPASPSTHRGRRLTERAPVKVDGASRPRPGRPRRDRRGDLLRGASSAARTFGRALTGNASALVIESDKPGLRSSGRAPGALRLQDRRLLAGFDRIGRGFRYEWGIDRVGVLAHASGAQAASSRRYRRHHPRLRPIPDLPLLLAAQTVCDPLRECTPARVASCPKRPRRRSIPRVRLVPGLLRPDSLRRAACPYALIQGQRDFFGSHTCG